MSTKTVTINSNLSYTITYSISNSSPTVTEVNFTKIQIVSPKGLSNSYELYFYLKDTGNYIQVAHGDVDAGTSSWTGTFSRTFSCSKTHSSSTAKIYFKLAMYSFDDDSQHINSGNISITVPAKTSYRITLKKNDGSSDDFAYQQKWYNEALTLITAKPTRTGYTFSHWDTKSDGSGANYSSGGTYPKGNNAAANLYAYWNIIKYTITYNANGGSGAPSAQTKNYGATVTISSASPSRTGYNFAGWYNNTSGTGTNYAGTQYSTNENLKLYAKWTKKTYTVSYSASGASNIPAAQTKTHGTTLKLSTTVPTKTNYVFNNWKASDGKTYSSGGDYTDNAGTTLTAQWYNPYSVTFNANGGSGAPSNLTKVYNQNLSIPSAAPSTNKQDCIFSGWYDNISSTGINYAGTTYSTNANLALYAGWTQAYESPTVSISNIFRADSNGDPDDEGTYLGLECLYYVYDTGSNSFTWSVICNDVTVTTPLDGGTTKTGTVKFLIAANLSTQQSYSATVTLTDDAIGAPSPHSNASTSQTKSIGTATYPIDIGMFNDGYGIALNGVATRNALDINFSDTHFGNLSTTGINLYSKTQTRNQPFIRIKPYDAYANGLIIGDGGLTLIGGGESANNLHDEIIDSLSDGEGTKRLYLCSDNNIYFNTNCGTIGDRKECYIDTAGDFILNNYETRDMLHDFSSASSENEYGNKWQSHDSRGVDIGYSQIVNTSTGVYRSFAVTNPRTDTTTALYLHSDDGGRVYANLGGNVTWEAADIPNGMPAAKITSDSTTTISNVITAGSGWTISSVTAKRWGKMCSLSVVAKKSSAITLPVTGDIDNQVIGTLKSGYLPADYAPGMCSTYSGFALLYTNGEVRWLTATPRSSAGTHAANTNLYFRFHYMLA